MSGGLDGAFTRIARALMQARINATTRRERDELRQALHDVAALAEALQRIRARIDKGLAFAATLTGPTTPNVR